MKGKESINDNTYDNLIEQASSLFDEKETSASSDTGPSLEEMRNRAANLKKRLLLHKNHADRHNLKAICEEGLKLARKITRGTGEMDLLSLEDELDIAETDLDLCEQEFQKELKQYDSIQELMKTHSLPSDMEIDFQIKISKAKIDVFSVPYSPENLVAEFRDYQEQIKNIEKYKRSLKNDFHKTMLNKFPVIEDYVFKMIDEEITPDNKESLTKELKDIKDNCEFLIALRDDFIPLSYESIRGNYKIDPNIVRQVSEFYQKTKDYSSMSLSEVQDFCTLGQTLKDRILDESSRLLYCS